MILIPKSSKLIIQVSHRMFRGISWFNHRLFCRPSYRYRIVPTIRNDDLGFRVALKKRAL